MLPNNKPAHSPNLFKKPGKYTSWKILELFILGSLIASVMWTLNFLYHYGYVTLDNTQAIVILNSGASLNTVDTRSFNNVKAVVKLKTDLPTIDNKIRNIFYYGNETSNSNPKSGKK
ncbi:MAG: hypothetical protein NT034_00375 [Candidatus Magasanikbacteria bacterium]|nr:hypothetical protein [Candidatus Magasanikbacteria bacterium]